MVLLIVVIENVRLRACTKTGTILTNSIQFLFESSPHFDVRQVFLGQKLLILEEIYMMTRKRVNGLKLMLVI